MVLLIVNFSKHNKYVLGSAVSRNGCGSTQATSSHKPSTFMITQLSLDPPFGWPLAQLEYGTTLPSTSRQVPSVCLSDIPIQISSRSLFFVIANKAALASSFRGKAICFSSDLALDSALVKIKGVAIVYFVAEFERVIQTVCAVCLSILNVW